MHSRLIRWLNRLLPFNFKIKHIPVKELGFTDLLTSLTTEKTLPISSYDNEFVVSMVNKILENLTVNSYCKKKNCTKNELLINNPADVYCLNNIINLDCANPTDGKKKILQHIQRSFFASVLNYVTDTIQICNCNHSRSESCTSNCFPLILSNFNFNQIFLSDKTFLS